MARKPIIQLDNKELKQLEKFVKERIEYVLYIVDTIIINTTSWMP